MISTSRMKTRKRKKTSGGEPLPLVLIVIVALVRLPAVAAEKRKAPDAAQPFALIAGTVYRTPGFALAAAEVAIFPEKTASEGYKPKKIKVLSDRRGEFAARVPAVPMRYTVRVKSTGYRPQEKSAVIEGEQRKDLSFLLEPEPSGGVK